MKLILRLIMIILLTLTSIPVLVIQTISWLFTGRYIGFINRYMKWVVYLDESYNKKQ